MEFIALINSSLEKWSVEPARSAPKHVALTFDPHPIRILRPREAPALVTPYPGKLKLLQQTGLDAVVILPFSRDLSMMPPFEFAEEILATSLRAVEVHEGFNFRFGHRAEGMLRVCTNLAASSASPSSNISR